MFGHRFLSVFPVISAITWLPGQPPKLCAQWDKIPQNFWVGGMPHGYSRGELVLLGCLKNVVRPYVYRWFRPVFEVVGTYTLGRGAAGPVAAERPRPAKLRAQLDGDGFVVGYGWPRPAASGRWSVAAARVVLEAGRWLAGANSGVQRWPAAPCGRSLAR